MRSVDRFVVPVTFVAALVAVLAVTVSWVVRPVTPVTLRVTMGPAGLRPDKVFGLRFTTFNRLSGHVVKQWAPDSKHCTPVTITNSRLTYIDQRSACILYDGSFKLPYRFPRFDDYIVFITLHPLLGPAQTYRFPVSLDYCTVMPPRQRRRVCVAPPAQLRGQEATRSIVKHGLTITLGAPAHALIAGEPAELAFLFTQGGRAVPDLQPLRGGLPGQAVAVSMDTTNVVLLQPDANQIAKGYVKGGAVSFAGQFKQPGIYRVFTTFRYRSHALRTSFVIDVDPQPQPTPRPTPD